MYWAGHAGWGAGAWIAMALLMVAFWAAVAWIIVVLVRRDRSPGAPPGPPPAAPPPAPQGGGTTALTILDERFARGELDEDEYRRRRAVLTGGP